MKILVGILVLNIILLAALAAVMAAALCLVHEDLMFWNPVLSVAEGCYLMALPLALAFSPERSRRGSRRAPVRQRGPLGRIYTGRERLEDGLLRRSQGMGAGLAPVQRSRRAVSKEITKIPRKKRRLRWHKQLE